MAKKHYLTVQTQHYVSHLAVDRGLWVIYKITQAAKIHLVSNATEELFRKLEEKVNPCGNLLDADDI